MEAEEDSFFPKDLGGNALEESQEEEWPSEATYWLFKSEPGMDDIYQKAGQSLDKMLEAFKIYPVNVDGDRVLYLGRFEIVKGGEASKYSDAQFAAGNVLGFMDFLCGFPMECTEMLLMVGEVSSRKAYKAGKLPVKDGKGEPTSPLPDEFFAGYEDDAILLNYLYLDTNYAQAWIDGLKGEPEPQELKWWVRVNFPETLAGVPLKFPYPGEFLSLAVRLMPDRYWDSQESSPFLFSGNWVDTIYYSSAVIKEVQEPTDERPYPTYTVQWRKDEIKEVRASDFAEYQVGDRVVILKDVETDKKGQLWKDDDMKEFDEETWVIAPMMFFGIDPDEEG